MLIAWAESAVEACPLIEALSEEGITVSLITDLVEGADRRCDRGAPTIQGWMVSLHVADGLKAWVPRGPTAAVRLASTSASNAR